MHCKLCGDIVHHSGLVDGYHDRCAKIQKCLEEKFWPEGYIYDTVFHLYKKYGLSLQYAPTHDIVSVARAIRNHWLVCRFLEEHPNIADKYRSREKAFMYYDILAAAEKEFLGHSRYGVPKRLKECLKTS